MLRDYVIKQERKAKQFDARHQRSQRRVIVQYDEQLYPSLPPHPVLFPVLEAGFEDGVYYHVTPYYGEQTLHQVLQETQLPHKEIVYAMRLIGAAFSHAHFYDILHLAFSAHSVVVDGFANLYVQDFGRKPTNLAPEQWLGQTVSPQTDVYALGCLLYHMMIGHELFGFDVEQVRRDAHLYEMPSIPVTVNSDVAHILNKSLAKSPQERFATVREMVNAIVETLRPEESYVPVDLPHLEAPQVLWTTHPQTWSIDAPLIAIDGQWVATTYSIFHIQSTEIQPVDIQNGITCFVMDNETPVIGYQDGTLQIGDRIIHAHHAPLTCLSVRDNCLLSGDENGLLILWQAGQLRTKLFTGGGAVRSCALGDGGHLILAGFDDGALRLYDSDAGKQAQNFIGHASAVTTCNLLGGVVISGDETGQVFYWDILNQDPDEALLPHVEAIVECDLLWIEDALVAVVVSSDGMVRVWHLSRLAILSEFSAAEWVLGASVVDHHIYVGTDSAVLCCPLVSLPFDVPLHTVVRGESDTVWVGGESLTQLNAKTGEHLREWGGHDATLAQILPFQEGMLVGDVNGGLRYQKGQHTIWKTSAHDDEIRFLLAIDHDHVVSGGADGQLMLWHMMTGLRKSIVSARSADLLCAVCHQDQLLVGTQEGHITVWDIQRGVLVETKAAIGIPVTALAVANSTLWAGLADGGLYDVDNQVGYAAHGVQIRNLSQVNNLLMTECDNEIAFWQGGECVARVQTEPQQQTLVIGEKQFFSIFGEGHYSLFSATS